MRRGFLLSAFAIATIVGGCRETRKLPGYYGETEPLANIVSKINQNNLAIPTLFARHTMQADIYDPQQKKLRFISADGDLFLRKPRELLMRGNKDLAGDAFELGSDPERYWLKVFLGDEKEWWGWHRNAGKECAKGMPVQPDLIGEVLGIGDINANFNEPPAPTVRFNNDLDVYMVIWNARLPDRWWSQKEIWYARKTLLPVKVLLYDQNGRVQLRANLTAHKPVKVPDVSPEQAPKIATEYDLFFPENGSRMKITLTDVALRAKTGQPKEGMIRFREDSRISPEKVIQIDKDCQ